MESGISDSYTLKEDSPLMGSIYDMLKVGEYDKALKTIKNEEYKSYLVHNSLETVPILSQMLQEDFCNIVAEECIEEMLTYIAFIANPKEALIVFLEEVEIFRSNNQFRVMFKPLQILLLKKVSTSANSSSFAWVFNTINNNIAMMPLPADKNLEGKETLLLDSDPNMTNITDILSCAVDFYDVFFLKVMSKDLAWPGKSMNTYEYFAVYLLQLFHKPLAYLNVSDSKVETPNTLFPICLKLVNMISSLLNNPFKLMSFVKHKVANKVQEDLQTTPHPDRELEEDETPESISQLSLAVYFYCVLAEGMSSSKVPCVYASEYVFMCCLPCCVYLFEEKDTASVYKGLMLFHSLLNTLNNESLPKNCLDIPNHLEILTSLVQIMTYCENKECRTMSLNSLKQWLWKFQSYERFRVFSIILTTINHPGLLGSMIHEIKENLRENMSKHSLIDNCFKGPKLQNILSLSCHLKDGERTDILEWSDKIMGALNLLIFVCLHDPQNVTDYRSVLPKISKDFLQPLENGIRISKAHYELKLKDLNEGESSVPIPEINVEVNCKSIPGIPPEQEKQMVQEAINWFDIMQSVWARANKIVCEGIALL